MSVTFRYRVKFPVCFIFSFIIEGSGSQFLCFVLFFHVLLSQGPYYGKELGWFVGGPNNAPTSYDVDGQLYAVDGSTLLIRGFSYNGQAPGKD